MAEPYIVTADTSIVQVDTSLNVDNNIILLSTINSPGVLVTIRDTTGFASPSNRIYISTTEGVNFNSFADIYGTVNLFTIYQPYGSITVTPKTSNLWAVVNTFAFSADQSAAKISQFTASTIASCNAFVGSINVSSIFASSLVTTEPYMAYNTITTTSTLFASTLQGAVLNVSSIIVNCNSPNYAIDINAQARITGSTIFTGAVGINTTTPGYSLDVAGTAHVTGTTLLNSLVTINNQGQGNSLLLQKNTSGVNTIDIQDSVPSATPGAWRVGTTNAGWGAGVGTSSFVVARTDATNSIPLVITPTGSVGINRAIPQATLDINGSVLCSSLQATAIVSQTFVNASTMYTSSLGVNCQPSYTLDVNGTLRAVSTLTSSITFNTILQGTQIPILYTSTVGGQQNIFFGSNNLVSPAALKSQSFCNITVGVVGTPQDAYYSTLAYVGTFGTLESAVSTNLCLYTSTLSVHDFMNQKSTCAAIDFTMDSYWYSPGGGGTTLSTIKQARYATIQSGIISSLINSETTNIVNNIPPNTGNFGFISLSPTVNGRTPTTATLMAHSSNVGIQCNIPRYTLDVNGSAHVVGALESDNNIIFANGSLLLHSNSVGGPDNIWFSGMPTNGWGSASHSTLMVGLRASGSYPGISIIAPSIYNNYVGINNPTPAYTLDVNGSVNIEGNGSGWGTTSLPTASFSISSMNAIANIGKVGGKTALLNFIKTTGGWPWTIGCVSNATNMYGGNQDTFIIGGTSYGEDAGISIVAGATANLKRIGINWGAPAYTLDVAGTIRATVDVIVTSDERVKENIATIATPLSMVEAMRGVYYTLKADPSSIRKVGVIAQEIETVLPEVVHTSEEENGMKAVSYGNITAVLIEGMKELSSTVKGLQAEVSTMKGN